MNIQFCAKDRTTTMFPVCRQCKRELQLRVPDYNYQMWHNRQASVQDAFPMLTADEREILISGICGKCFDGIFK
jgi:hypothetical protein